jgi:hypothetical protein
MNAQTLLLALVAANAISLATFVGRKLVMEAGYLKQSPYSARVRRNGLITGYL